MPPSGWAEHTFADLIDAGTLQIGDGYRAENAELGGDGPIFLRAGHVTDTHIDFEGVDRFRATLADRVRPKMSRPGDVIVTTKGNSTGRVAFVTRSMPPFVYSPHLSYWRTLDPKRLDSGFLRYWSRGVEFGRQLAGLKASTDMAPYLSLADQKRLRVSLPPIEDQRIVARALGSMDDKIDLNRRMNATLEAIARAIFRSWFVDFDPVRAKMDGRPPHGMDAETAGLFADHFDSEEPDMRPAGWVNTWIGECADFVSGGTPRMSNPDYWGGSIPWVSAKDMKAARLYDSEDHITELGASKGTRVVPPGSTLMLVRGMTLHQDLPICLALRETAFNQDVKAILPRPHVGRYFLHQWLLEHKSSLLNLVDSASHGTGRIHTDVIKKVGLVIPPPGLIEAFDSTIQPIADRLRVNDEESITLAALRDALLPKLLSGEVRVKDAERLVEAQP